MSGILQTLLSLAAAGTMMFSQAANTGAPQNDDEGLLFLTNRQWRLSSTYYPTLRMTHVPGQVRQLRPDASEALEVMYAAFKQETGKTLISVSGFRDYDKQDRLYTRKLKNTGSEAKADEYVARPGASEHQLGIAMDVGQMNEAQLAASFGKTEGGRWVKENSWRYGFIVRYGAEWEPITGYKYEPWHVRYVGKEVAASIHKDPVPLETYLLKHRKQVLLDLLNEED